MRRLPQRVHAANKPQQKILLKLMRQRELLQKKDGEISIKISHAIALIIVLWVLFALTPSAWVMSAVHERMEFGESPWKGAFYHSPIATAYLLIDGRGSCGHYSAVLATLLTLKGEKAFIVDLVTCPSPPCGHTVVNSNGVWLDATHNRVYERNDFFEHDWEIWSSPTGSIKVNGSAEGYWN